MHKTLDVEDDFTDGLPVIPVSQVILSDKIKKGREMQNYQEKIDLFNSELKILSDGGYTMLNVQKPKNNTLPPFTLYVTLEDRYISGKSDAIILDKGYENSVNYISQVVVLIDFKTEKTVKDQPSQGIFEFVGKLSSLIYLYYILETLLKVNWLIFVSYKRKIVFNKSYIFKKEKVNKL